MYPADDFSKATYFKNFHTGVDKLKCFFFILQENKTVNIDHIGLLGKYIHSL